MAGETAMEQPGGPAADVQAAAAGNPMAALGGMGNVAAAFAGLDPAAWASMMGGAQAPMNFMAANPANPANFASVYQVRPKRPRPPPARAPPRPAG